MTGKELKSLSDKICIQTEELIDACYERKKELALIAMQKGITKFGYNGPYPSSYNECNDWFDSKRNFRKNTFLFTKGSRCYYGLTFELVDYDFIAFTAVRPGSWDAGEFEMITDKRIFFDPSDGDNWKVFPSLISAMEEKLTKSKSSKVVLSKKNLKFFDGYEIEFYYLREMEDESYTRVNLSVTDGVIYGWSGFSEVEVCKLEDINVFGPVLLEELKVKKGDHSWVNDFAMFLIALIYPKGYRNFFDNFVDDREYDDLYIRMWKKDDECFYEDDKGHFEMCLSKGLISEYFWEFSHCPYIKLETEYPF